MDRFAALLIAACGAADKPVVGNTGTTAPVDLTITTSRTPCLGRCPEYSMVIHGNGTVNWIGTAHVRALGDRHATVPVDLVQRLDAAVDSSKFFARDAYGKIEIPPVCDANGCSFPGFTVCSDTSRTHLQVKRGAQVHAIDDHHCEVDPTLDAFERLVEKIAIDQGWL